MLMFLEVVENGRIWINEAEIKKCRVIFMEHILTLVPSNYVTPGISKQVNK